MPQVYPSQEAPDWRYAVACAELHKEQSNLPIHAACSDFSVKHLKRVLALLREPDVPESMIRATSGAVADLVEWYERDLDTRFFLESLILGRADNDVIRKHLGDEYKAPMLSLYRSWFFDVAERLDQNLWIENKVLRPALYRAQNELSPLKRSRLHVAHMWKALGYYGGYEKLELAMSSGLTYDGQTAQFLRKYCTSKNLRSVLASMDDPNRDEFGLQQHAQVHSWSTDEVRTERELMGNSDEMSDKVSEAIALRLNPAVPSGKVDEIERITVPTYTEEDLPHAR